MYASWILCQCPNVVLYIFCGWIQNSMCEQHNEIKDDYDVSFSTQLDFSIITFAREVSVCFHQCLFFFCWLVVLSAGLHQKYWKDSHETAYAPLTFTVYFL